MPGKSHRYRMTGQLGYGKVARFVYKKYLVCVLTFFMFETPIHLAKMMLILPTKNTLLPHDAHVGILKLFFEGRTEFM